MSERSPLLAEVIRNAIEADRAELMTCIPAEVHKWDASKGRADCRILIKRAYDDEEGARQTESMPIVPGCAVAFIGAGDFRITCPISDGTLVIGGKTIKATIGVIWFSQRSLDKFLSGSGQEVDPEFDHMHHLADGIFTPGLRPFGRPWESMPTDHMSLGYDTGVQLHLRHDVAVVADNEASAQFVALANLVKARLDTIQEVFDGHVHTNFGTTSVPTTLIGGLAGVAAETLKAK